MVSDRANHRFEYYTVAKDDPSKFAYSNTSTMDIFRNNTGLVCNARFLADHLIAPTLEGYVFILDSNNQAVSTVNVNGLLGAKGFKHPHDAIFLPNGDFVVATWSPGRIGYFRKL